MRIIVRKLSDDVDMDRFRRIQTISAYCLVDSYSVTVIAVIITVIMHYRRKKNNTHLFQKWRCRKRLLPSPADTGPLPDWLASSNPDNLRC